MIRVFQVKCSQESGLEAALLKKLNMPKEDLKSWSIHRRSVDARNHEVLFSYVIDADVRHEKKYLKKKYLKNDVVKTPRETFDWKPSGTRPLCDRPVVAGFGPAGMFAALLLAQNGYRPLILERGSRIEQRQKDVDAFWKEGLLNPESNVQFGEGGAGAFSDGKLTTRSKDVLGRKVLRELVQAGADPEILIEQHPHIGTDAFVKIIRNIRQEIESLGGKFLFDTRLEDLLAENHRLEAIVANGETIPAQALILAAGHSASDVYALLEKRGVQLQAKPFAVGVRIEHPQQFINEAMLGEYAQDPRLIPARYQLTCKTSGNKGVYTFCMCPGGYVIPSASEPERLVVNGMSYAARAGENANSALLVQIDETDTGPGVQAGLRYQEDLEKKAFSFSSDWRAPVQLAKDYLNGQVSDHFEETRPTYELGTVFADLNTLFSAPVNAALHEALLDFEKKVPGFIEKGLLTGVESRSSAAVKIVRDSGSRMAAGMEGLYPAGEGSGYAGGIMTSAIDGLRSAMALMDTFAPPAGSDKIEQVIE